jgi:eukaryotic-like serine/threonine-protein kinase
VQSASPSLVVGRYAIFESFASGGMATLHLGRLRDETGSSIVAIKRLHPHLRKDEAFALALLDEANLARRIRHPNVVQVLDVVGAESELLLIMEYVPGLSLGQLIASGGGAPLPVAVAVAIIVAVLHGLHAAHLAEGEDGRPLHLVHRDVSPQNILVDVHGIVRITDFGVAKAVGRLRSTRDGKIRGKLAYMAPEQAADERLDARADVYAAGVVLWELLTGAPLFDAETDAALFGKVLQGTTRRLAQVRPDLPLVLDQLLARALARDPRRRFPTAAAFAEALETAVSPPAEASSIAAWVHAAAGEALAKRRAMITSLDEFEVGPTLVAASVPSRSQSRVRPASGRKTSGRPLLVVGAVLLLILIVGAFLIGRRQAEPAATRTARMPRTLGERAGSTTLSAVVSAAPSEAASLVSPPAPSAPGMSATAARTRSAAPRRNAHACEPPFTVDPEGVRHFKPECVH